MFRKGTSTSGGGQPSGPDTSGLPSGPRPEAPSVPLDQQVAARRPSEVFQPEPQIDNSQEIAAAAAARAERERIARQQAERERQEQAERRAQQERVTPTAATLATPAAPTVEPTAQQAQQQREEEPTAPRAAEAFQQTERPEAMPTANMIDVVNTYTGDVISQREFDESADDVTIPDEFYQPEFARPSAPATTQQPAAPTGEPVVEAAAPIADAAPSQTQPRRADFDEEALEEFQRENYYTQSRSNQAMPVVSNEEWQFQGPVAPRPEPAPAAGQVPPTPPPPPTGEPAAATSLPDGEEGWHPRQERDISKRLASVQNIALWLQDGHFTVSGSVTKNNKVVYPPEVQQELEDTRRFFGSTEADDHFLFEMISQLYGLTPDTLDRLWSRADAREQKVFWEHVVNGWKIIKRKMLDPNIRQPFAYTDQNLNFGGVYRFPIPILRNELAVFLGNNRPGYNAKLSPQDIQEFGVQAWRDQVLPALKVKGVPRGSETNPQAQRLAILDIVDAVELNNNTVENFAQRLPDSDFTIQEALDPLDGWASIFDNEQEFYENQARVADRMAKLVDEVANANKKVVKDHNGNITTVRDIKDNTAQWALRMATKAARGTGLYNPVVGVWAMTEHAQGNITNKLAGWLLRKWGPPRTNGQPYEVITDNVANLSMSPEIVSVITDAIGVYATGGRAALASYLKGGGHLGNNTGTKTLKEATNAMSGSEKARYIAETGLNRYVAFGAKIATGGLILKGADAKRFMEFLQFTMQRMEGSTVSAQTFETMFRQNPTGFIEEMLQRPEGNDALIQTMDSTIGTVNIWTEAFNRLIERSAISEFAFAAFVTRYMGYGLNITGKFMPMTHTFNYLVTRGFSRMGENRHNLQDLTFGGNDSFSRGLLQNIILDAAWLGTRGAMLALGMGIVGMLGIEPPDDEEKRNVYGEWKIGGVAIEENWMMRDVLGFVSPAVVGFHAQLNGADGYAVFLDGALTTLAGNPFLQITDITGFITHFDENLVSAQEETRESWGEEAPSDLEYMATKSATWGLTTLAKFFEMPAIRMGYQEAGILSGDTLTPSVTMRYTQDPTDDATATERVSWSESQFRSVARRYPMIADLLNWANGYDSGNEAIQQTGYRKEQMPLVEISDPVNSYWRERFTVDDAMTPEEKQIVVNDVIAVIRDYDSPEQIAADGIIIPYTARQAAYDYLYGTINAIKNQRALDYAVPGWYSGNGNTSAENQLMRDQRYLDDTTKTNELYTLTTRLSDNRIPYSPVKYNQWETDWVARYEWKDSGESANALDHVLQPDAVEKIWYASGDHKSGISPFLSVDDRYNTFDAQTPAAWWNEELSSFERLQPLYGDAVAGSGIFEGQNIYDILSGQGNAPVGTGENWNPIALAGQRALVPVNEGFDKTKLLDGNREGAWYGNVGELGTKDAVETNWPSSSFNNSGGRSYSKSGGGGGGYSPSIYSHAAYSLNADKAQTMYSKSPTYTRFDYLRPGFETKGSREAYRREDI